MTTWEGGVEAHRPSQSADCRQTKPPAAGPPPTPPTSTPTPAPTPCAAAPRPTRDCISLRYDVTWVEYLEAKRGARPVSRAFDAAWRS